MIGLRTYQHPLVVEVALGFATVPFATIKNKDSLETEGLKYIKKSIQMFKIRKYKYWIWCKETAQSVRDELYPHLQSQPIRDEVD